MAIVTTNLSADDATAVLVDPGAAELAAASDWSALVAYLNAAGFTRPRQSIAREPFLLTIAGCGFRIAALPEPYCEGWKITLSMILASTSVTVSSTQVQDLLALGISQGVVTQQEVDALTLEPCTRAESLLGRALAYELTAADLQAVLGD